MLSMFNNPFFSFYINDKNFSIMFSVIITLICFLTQQSYAFSYECKKCSIETDRKREREREREKQ